MRCQSCKQQAVFAAPNFCKKHFITYFENKVKQTIRNYHLFNKKDKLVVAVSGGKDSLTVLYILKKFGYNVHALAIDEGIAGYREHTLVDLKRFCNKYYVPVLVLSYAGTFGKTLDTALPILKEKPCTVCGTFRRYLLNKSARDLHADVLVTGHNLDDEAQAVLMNFFKNHLDLLARQGPRSGVVSDKQFIPRVKPLYFCTEKEVLLYSYLHGFVSQYVECPHTQQAFRADVALLLNQLSQVFPGVKQNLIARYLHDLPLLQKKTSFSSPEHCQHCGEPCHGTLCKACQYSQRLAAVGVTMVRAQSH